MIAQVSVSGGKDSTATLLVALETLPRDAFVATFCDTGNEHPMTYEYIGYLAEATGVPIKTLKPDFTDWWWHRRDYVRDHWGRPHKNYPDGVPQADIDRVLSFFEKGPTGNPYLDLCIIKGRFPARRSQFCTQFLKTEPSNEYALELIEKHGAVESWQGVRAEESANRAKLPDREDVGGGLTIFRPILRWNVDQVFAQHRKHGIDPNPLYKLGMNRVGCMPCINAAKPEILEISKRFPDQIDRIEEWERLVSTASKRGMSSFFPAPLGNRGDLMGRNIREVVRWLQTQRGGRLVDMFKAQSEPLMCSSAYGLCE